jgi:hypothetical protein
MTSRERFRRVMTFQRADRLPILELENYEVTTIERWRREGLPADQTPTEFLGMDRVEPLIPNIWPRPRFERKVLAEDEEYVTVRDEHGLVTRSAKRNPSMIYIHEDYPIKTRRDWEAVKECFDPKDPARYPADWGPAAFERYNTCEHPVGLILHPFFYRFGYYFMGTENFMLAFYDDPEMMHDIFRTIGEFTQAVIEPILQNVKIDYVAVAEDLAYKNSSSISPAMYREFWLPYQSEVLGLCRAYGVPIIALWSSGDIRPILPLAIESGFNATWPLEAIVGITAPDLRRQYGKGLALAGNIGIHSLIAGKDAIKREVETKVVPLLDEGGFIPTVDDMTPPEVSFENYCYYISLLRELSF